MRGNMLFGCVYFAVGWLAIGAAPAGLDAGRLEAQVLGSTGTEVRIVTAKETPDTAGSPSMSGVGYVARTRPELITTLGSVSPMPNSPPGPPSAGATGPSGPPDTNTTQLRLVISEPAAPVVHRTGHTAARSDSTASWIPTSPRQPTDPASPPAEAGWVRLTFHAASPGAASPTHSGQFPEDSVYMIGEPVARLIVQESACKRGVPFSHSNNGAGPQTAWTSPQSRSSRSASQISPGDAGWSQNPLRQGGAWRAP